MDWVTFLNPKVSVKGGIPIMFPLAGGLPEGVVIPAELSALKQHGFARESSGWLCSTIDGTLVEQLREDKESLRVFPYQFDLTTRGVLEKDGSCSINQVVYNSGTGLPLPISIGLHPYFKVPRDAKEDIKFDFPGGEAVRANLKGWTGGKAMSIPNPFLTDGVPIEVTIPGTGKLNIMASCEYERIWFWSKPDTDYICIEPVMGDKGRIVKNPVNVWPHARAATSVNIRLN